MKPRQTWHEWLEALIQRYDTAKACAADLGIDPSKLSRWRTPYLTEPKPEELERAAQMSGTPLDDVVVMAWRAVKRRHALRAAKAIVLSVLTIGGTVSQGATLPVDHQAPRLPLIGRRRTHRWGARDRRRPMPQPLVA